jgi:hypothetical protein
MRACVAQHQIDAVGIKPVDTLAHIANFLLG